MQSLPGKTVVRFVYDIHSGLKACNLNLTISNIRKSDKTQSFFAKRKLRDVSINHMRVFLHLVILLFHSLFSLTECMCLLACFSSFVNYLNKHKFFSSWKRSVL